MTIAVPSPWDYKCRFILHSELTAGVHRAIKDIPGAMWGKGRRMREITCAPNCAPVVDQMLTVLRADYSYQPPKLQPEPIPWRTLEAHYRNKGEVREQTFAWLYDFQKLGLCMSVTAPGFHFWWPGGAGKTLAFILWGLARRFPLIILTKTATRMQVASQVRKWTILEPYVIRPRSSFRRKRDWEAYPTLTEYVQQCRADGVRPVISCGWDTLPRYVNEMIEALDPKNYGLSVVYDELHVAKSPRRSRKVYADKPDETGKIPYHYVKSDNIVSCAADLSRAATRRLGSTATPIKDRTRDLWGQLDLIEPYGWGVFTSSKGGSFAHRYCIPGTMRILMWDGTYKPIEEVAVGDYVLGWDQRPGDDVTQPDWDPVRKMYVRPNQAGYRTLRPTRVIWAGRREAEVVRFSLANGEYVECTRDHRWFVNPEQPRPGTWFEPYLPLGRAGAKHVLSVAHRPDPPNQGTKSYRYGYLRGLLDGDGHISWRFDARPERTVQRAKRRVRQRQYRAVLALKEIDSVMRAHRYARELGLEPSEVRPRSDGLWTFGIYKHEHWRTISKVHTKPWGDSYWRGWLAGMYDAEGSREDIHQYIGANPTKHADIQAALTRFGFSYRVEAEKIAILGGKQALLRFWEMMRPSLTYKMQAAWAVSEARFGEASGFVPEPVQITHQRSRGVQTVYSIQTETGNYITEGYASKNCAATPGRYAGWNTKGLSNVPELRGRLAFVTLRLKKEDTHKDLPPLRRESWYLTPDEQNVGWSSAKLQRELKKAQRRGPSAVNEVGLSYAASMKLSAVIDMVLEALEEGQKVLVLDHRQEHVDKSYAEFMRRAGRYFQKAWGKDSVDGNSDRLICPETGSEFAAWGLHGGNTDADTRRAIVAEEYMPHPGPAVLFGTGQALGTGLDIHDTDLLILVGLPDTGGDLHQWEQRVHRQGMKRNVLVRYVVAQHTADEVIVERLISKLPAMEEVTGDTETAAAYHALAGVDDPEALTASILAKLEEVDDFDIDL